MKKRAEDDPRSRQDGNDDRPGALFSRGDGRDEESKPVDVSAMLEAIASDLSDAGRPISLSTSPEAVLRCKPLAQIARTRGLAFDHVESEAAKRRAKEPDRGR